MNLQDVSAHWVALHEELNGKRELNLRQVKALAARFSVPLEVFA